MLEELHSVIARVRIAALQAEYVVPPEAHKLLTHRDPHLHTTLHSPSISPGL